MYWAPVGAALAAALDSQQNQVMTDKRFSTIPRWENDFKRGVLGTRKGCPYITPNTVCYTISNGLFAVKFILFPFCRIVFDIIRNRCIGFFISNDVFVIIPLPKFTHCYVLGFKQFQTSICHQ